MHKNVLRISKNVFGRDFVVGDIHGAYDLVVQAMKKVNFDPACDRIFSVGDLIDRGPGSHRCAKFLAQPYVFAVTGNHEKMYIEMYDEAKSPEDVQTMIEVLAGINFNGMGWLGSTTEEQRQEMLVAFRKLPIVIELETDRGTVGLVHADVPKGMGWGEFVNKIDTGDEYVTKFAIGMLDESRDRIYDKRQDGVEGVGRVFVGHTPQDKGVHRYGNVYAVDTGAVFGEAGKMPGAHLAMLNVNMKTGLLSQPRDSSNISLVDVRFPDDLPTHPFFNISESKLLGSNHAVSQESGENEPTFRM